MYKECSAKVRMYCMILKEGRFDEKVHHCRVISYKPEEECIYLIAEDTELSVSEVEQLAGLQTV